MPALFTSTSTGAQLGLDGRHGRAHRLGRAHVELHAKAADVGGELARPAPSRSATATRAPSAASREQVAAPMPPAPPVTSATLPSSLIGRPPYPSGRLRAREQWRPIPIVGGTGALGFGLALRLAAAGRPVVIGSRDAGRAEEAAGRVRDRCRRRQVAGRWRTPTPARRGPIVFLTVPFRAQSENLTNLKEALTAGQILVDATVPLAAAVSGKATRLLGVPQGSAAEQAQEMVPDGVTVVSALHTVSAATLGDLDADLDEDVLVRGETQGRQAAWRPSDRARSPACAR